MKINDKRGLWTLAALVVIIVVLGVIMLRLSQSPKVTPAGAAGSMQGQLQRRTNPPR